MDPREAQAYLNEKRRVRKWLYLQPNVRAFCNKVRPWPGTDKQEDECTTMDGEQQGQEAKRYATS